MKPIHTPTPWVLQGEGILLHPVTKRPVITTRIETANGAGFIELIDRTNEFDGNAGFILQTVNRHDELVEGLRACAAFLYSWGQDPPATKENRLNAFRDQAEYARQILANLE